MWIYGWNSHFYFLVAYVRSYESLLSGRRLLDVQYTGGLVVVTRPSDPKVMGFNPVTHQQIFIFETCIGYHIYRFQKETVCNKFT